MRQEGRPWAGKEKVAHGGDSVTTSGAGSLVGQRGALAQPRRRRSDHPGGECLAALDARLSARYTADPAAIGVLNLARGRALAA